MSLWRSDQAGTVCAGAVLLQGFPFRATQDPSGRSISTSFQGLSKCVSQVPSGCCRITSKPVPLRSEGVPSAETALKCHLQLVRARPSRSMLDVGLMEPPVIRNRRRPARASRIAAAPPMGVLPDPASIPRLARSSEPSSQGRSREMPFRDARGLPWELLLDSSFAFLDGTPRRALAPMSCRA